MRTDNYQSSCFYHVFFYALSTFCEDIYLIKNTTYSLYLNNLFEDDEFEVNENLKAANERYKSEVKKMNAKQKRQSKK